MKRDAAGYRKAPKRASAVERAIRDLPFERYRVEALVDASGYYAMPLDPDFPLAVKLFRYDREPFPLHCHERLEIAVMIEGEGYFRSGGQRWTCSAGDLVVVDSLKLHSFQDFKSDRNRVAVITFLPSLVYNLGSPPEDYIFLVPFHCQTEAVSPVIRVGDEVSAPVNRALARLLKSYFEREPYYTASCKVALLEVLLCLAKHFRATQVARTELSVQRQRASRFGKLIDYMHQHLAEPISVDEAASMVAMSRSRFTHLFTKVAGESFISYKAHLRLNQAVRLLRESDVSVAEVAAAGFADQSYFDRRFKQRFGTSPRRYRLRFQGPAGSGMK